LKETLSGHSPKDGLRVKLATGGEFMAVHPVSNTNTAIPTIAITVIRLTFTVLTLSYYTSSAFA
jgi:hypothetical protein